MERLFGRLLNAVELKQLSNILSLLRRQRGIRGERTISRKQQATFHPENTFKFGIIECGKIRPVLPVFPVP